jgi:UDP-N-acetyl-2-amino-2-deoxyglucuronate dehydrogenase
MSEQFRFGIIGSGVIAAMHAEAIHRLPDAQLVAISDVIPEKAQKLSAKYRVNAYDDPAEMLRQEKPDIACICTPSGMHGEHAILAMRAGCHVVVEKPMEINRSAIDDMLRVQQEQGVKLTVISQHRFDSSTKYVHELVTHEALGKLVLGNAIVPWWRSQAYYDSGDWRGTWALDGGGVLMNQSIHSIDLLQWLLGPVQSLHAYTSTLVHKIEVEDVASVTLRFVNGALGTITATTGAYPGLGARIEVYGDKGSAVIDNDQLVQLKLTDESENMPEKQSERKGENALNASSDPAALTVESHRLQIADLMRAIRENGTPLVDGPAGARPVEIILAIYESARTKREVVLS